MDTGVKTTLPAARKLPLFSFGAGERSFGSIWNAAAPSGSPLRLDCTGIVVAGGFFLELDIGLLRRPTAVEP
jgi:hypothetical protein